MHLFVLGKEQFLCQGLFCVCGIVAEGIFIRKPQETAGFNGREIHRRIP